MMDIEHHLRRDHEDAKTLLLLLGIGIAFLLLTLMDDLVRFRTINAFVVIGTGMVLFAAGFLIVRKREICRLLQNQT